MQNYRSLNSFLILLTLFIIGSCKPDDEMKVFDLIPGKLSIELPADWAYGPETPLYEDSIYHRYIGRQDTLSTPPDNAGIFVYIKKAGLFSTDRLRYSLIDYIDVFADSISILKEKTILLNNDTTSIMLYSFKIDKKKFYGGVGYNAEFLIPRSDTLNRNNLIRFFFVHDEQKNLEELEVLCDKIFGSIKIVK